MTKSIYHIYKITNLINHKCYIGFTSNPKRRWNAHQKRYMKYDDQPKLYNAFKKYGIENFTFEVIYSSSDFNHVLNEMESNYIKEHDSIKNGYNISSGGEGCLLSTEGKERRKLLLKLQGYIPPMTGKTHTKEVRDKLSKCSINFWSTHPEQKQKMSKLHKGKCLTEETKRKMSKARLSPQIYKLKDEKWLRNEHHVLKKSIHKISKELKTKEKNVKTALIVFGLTIYRYGAKHSVKTKWNEDRHKKHQQRMVGNKLNLGKKHSLETINKLKNWNCKFIYEIQLPDGKIIQTINLTEFSENHKIRRCSLSKIANTDESYKGYFVKKFSRKNLPAILEPTSIPPKQAEGQTDQDLDQNTHKL